MQNNLTLDDLVPKINLGNTYHGRFYYLETNVTHLCCCYHNVLAIVPFEFLNISADLCNLQGISNKILSSAQGR